MLPLSNSWNSASITETKSFNTKGFSETHRNSVKVFKATIECVKFSNTQMLSLHSDGLIFNLKKMKITPNRRFLKPPLNS